MLRRHLCMFYLTLHPMMALANTENSLILKIPTCWKISTRCNFPHAEKSLTLKNFTFAEFHLVYIWKVVFCTAKFLYFRCSPDVISTASSGLLPIDVPKIKVHHFRCSKAVEIWRVQQMAVNFTAFCQIVAFILKVVFSITISHRKYDF